MIFFAAILTAIFYGAAIWVYIFLPKWARFSDSEMIGIWYGMGWIIPFTAATVPTALMWTNL